MKYLAPLLVLLIVSFMTANSLALQTVHNTHSNQLDTYETIDGTFHVVTSYKKYSKDPMETYDFRLQTLQRYRADEQLRPAPENLYQMIQLPTGEWLNGCPKGQLKGKVLRIFSFFRGGTSEKKEELRYSTYALTTQRIYIYKEGKGFREIEVLGDTLPENAYFETTTETRARYNPVVVHCRKRGKICGIMLFGHTKQRDEERPEYFSLPPEYNVYTMGKANYNVYVWEECKKRDIGNPLLIPGRPGRQFKYIPQGRAIGSPPLEIPLCSLPWEYNARYFLVFTLSGFDDTPDASVMYVQYGGKTLNAEIVTNPNFTNVYKEWEKREKKVKK